MQFYYKFKIRIYEIYKNNPKYNFKFVPTTQILMVSIELVIDAIRPNLKCRNNSQTIKKFTNSIFTFKSFLFSKYLQISRKRFEEV